MRARIFNFQRFVWHPNLLCRANNVTPDKKEGENLVGRFSFRTLLASHPRERERKKERAGRPALIARLYLPTDWAHGNNGLICRKEEEENE